MKFISVALLAPLLMGGSSAVRSNAQTKSTAITLEPGKIRILDPQSNAAPVHRAVLDLQSDFEKVFGQKPEIETQLSSDAGTVIEVVEGKDAHAPGRCTTPESTEAFAFNSQLARGRALVCLSGADMRGTIFAVYHFSQTYLGVDPMYFWTDHEPLKQERIILPASFARTFPSPVFRYRGFFINDEDLLTGWAPAKPGEQSSITAPVWDKICETILRLKGNMIVPGTWTFPDDLQWKVASERGLVLSQHHATPLGLNAARWPKDVPYNYTTHPEILERAWANAVKESQPHAEILWTVGLRGLSDIGYDVMDPSVKGNDQALGALISKAIAKQIAIVQQRDPHASFISDLWQEGARLMRAGYLKVPSNVTMVWADTGYGLLQDGGTVQAGQGAYYHVAMMNNSANQLSEMVPVDRIQSELARFQAARATGYLLLNTSDIRPVAMTTRKVMEIGWGGQDDHETASAAYYRNWSAEEFGSKAANDIATVYKLYFAAPALLGSDKHEAGDQFYHTEMRMLLGEAMDETPMVYLPDQAPKWQGPRLLPYLNGDRLKGRIDQDIALCSAAQPRWDAVWSAAQSAQSLVKEDRRSYYQAAVLTMIEINRQSNQALLKVAQSLKAHQSHDTEGAKAFAAAAVQALQQVQGAKDKAQYGRWQHWYRGDWLDGVSRTQEVLTHYTQHLDDPYAPLTPPIDWNDWEAYHYILAYQGDRTVDVQ